ncbi:MAG: thioredoxin-disulfide reductase [bacterium]|nr:thioredoxin-disulfide reductase [bacterium]
MNNKINRSLIIVGSGPAGYTAAIYAARANLKPLVLAGPQPGGQLTTTTEVENFPGFVEGIKGPELMARMQKQSERFGAEVKFEVATKADLTGDVKKIWVGETKYQAKAIIITTGAGSRTLELPREKDLWSRGVHTCATCDGFFYKDKIVAVIGGGDSAMEESTFLSGLAKKVYIIYRKDKFPASEIMKKRTLENDKIEVLWNSEVIEYLGEEKLTGVRIKNNQTNAEKNLEINALFFAIGHIPNTEIFRGQITLDDKAGYIKTHENVFTDIAGVFAAGDCVDFTYRQAITSAGFGCMAAMAAERWLQTQST